MKIYSAAGYITKDNSEEIIAGAIRVVAQGRHYLDTHLAVQALRFNLEPADTPNSPPLSSGLANSLLQARTVPKTSPAVEEWGLTTREKKVLLLMCQGFKNRDIADSLYLSVYTVENHVKSILSKTGLPVANRSSRFTYNEKLRINQRRYWSAPNFLPFVSAWVRPPSNTLFHYLICLVPG